MLTCPLCGNPVNSIATAHSEKPHKAPAQSISFSPYGGRSMNQPQRKITWEIVSIILVSIIVATGIINLIINNRITWAEYPIAICLIIFSYVSVFAFWAQRTVIQIIISFVAAATSLCLLDLLTNGLNWALTLAIPLLLATNMVVIGLIKIIRLSKQKGVNLIAYGFLAAALICICIEGILDFYLNHPFGLWWSVIVSVCILPVSVVLLLMNYRYKRGRDLQKTFHL